MNVSKASRDIKELNPLAQQACNLFLSECKRQGVNIFITETYRSQARQNYLYEQGRTRAGQIVTWTRNSNHTGRMAWDIAVSPPKALYDIATLNKAGAIAKDLGITWGGTWKTPDRPHFEINSNWKPPKAKMEEMITMALAKWQEDMGKQAIDSLSKKRDNKGQPIVNSPEDWKKTLGDDIPQWLFWSIIDRISK